MASMTGIASPTGTEKKTLLLCTEARLHYLVQVSLPPGPFFYNFCPPAPTTDITFSLHSAHLPPHFRSVCIVWNALSPYFYLSTQIPSIFQGPVIKMLLSSGTPSPNPHCLLTEPHDSFPKAFLPPVSHSLNPPLTPWLDYPDLTLFVYIRIAFPISGPDPWYATKCLTPSSG